MLDRRLHLHLASWLGQWPAGPGLHVVGSHRRARPAWDGRLRPAVAVTAGTSTVLSVAPDRVEAVRELARRPGGPLLAALPATVGRPGWATHDDVFRWSAAPAPLPDVGEWTPPTAVGLPPWLRLFDRPVLVVRDDRGRYLSGVGIKRHDAYGHELAVGTVPAARGRGLARRLVAQAARRVLDEGAVPTYLHAAANTASARVAAAAGFADRGWRSYGVYPP
ncbi:GNAT family N-acetyltransferase [Micromonospora peucetia]|uniref:FR47-like protein n=1 Tax=Micromonospora peucetia TaxID=47871 RepID=A0A1C6U810_9ACTN|nr:GNAT family N-acetyltransferase [Micromonospora peucetia]MCX4386253.1 GNAT family N-acetyltransferase [Micromonospora peucetia]WSA33596.1 GNAT family N-acetyltransferase [Micromonospora peucetia]SCL50186.1 FR47-like protein [Micromonospora peucetia]